MFVFSMEEYWSKLICINGADDLVQSQSVFTEKQLFNKILIFFLNDSSYNYFFL